MMSSFSFKVKVVGSADPILLLLLTSNVTRRFFGGREAAAPVLIISVTSAMFLEAAAVTSDVYGDSFETKAKAVDDSSGGVPICSSL